MLQFTLFISLSLAASYVNAAAVSSLTSYGGGGQDVQVSSETISTIKQVIEDEITSHIVKAYLGAAPQYAAFSCKQIAEVMPHSQSGSGYYWIQGKSGPLGVYCDINPERFNQSGGWMRIANIDMKNNQTQCPSGLRYDFLGNSDQDRKHLCHKPSLAAGCASTTFPVQGVKYTRVCGNVIGYQFFQPNGFGPNRYTPGIHTTYVDGVSITHGSPRHHVWTLAGASSDIISSVHGHSACPCINPSSSFSGTVSSFVSDDYYCESGSRNIQQKRYYFDDPLWDGKGCSGQNKCCDRGGPWFCTELEGETSDDIEIRLCANDGDGNDVVLLEKIELYVN